MIFTLRSAALVALILVSGLVSDSDADETYFAFDSSPRSYVGQGFTDYYVAPETGWTITAYRNYRNGVTFSIRRDSGTSEGYSNYYWTLNLAAPYSETLEPGLYSNAARFPFQDIDQPGLTLSGNHRGNNRNAGFFEVLEAVYDADGNVERFSADFVQYGEQNVERWIMGSIRFNASPPVVPADIKIVPVRRKGVVNLRSKGTLPVVIYGDESINTEELNLDTVTFAAAAPVANKKGKRMKPRLKDFNRDGFTDILIRFPIRDMEIVNGEQTVELTGELNDGTSILGSEMIDGRGKKKTSSTD